MDLNFYGVLLATRSTYWWMFDTRGSLWFIADLLKTNKKMNSTSTPKTIRVVAPATLEQDFTFDVTLGGIHGNRPFTVTVPEGGVLEGEEFDIPYPSGDEYSEFEQDEERLVSAEEDEEKKTEICHSGSQGDDTEQFSETGAPMKRWRNHLLSCCDVLTQSTFWMALVCSPVLIAQLVTRLHLTYWGVPPLKAHRVTTMTVLEDAVEEASLSYNKIVLSFVAVLCFANLLPAVGLVVVAIYMLLLMVCVGSNIRRTMRQKYQLPYALPYLQSCRRCFCRPVPKRGVKPPAPRVDRGNGYVEDYLCLFFCGCCSLIQMARHTHNDKEYPGFCCTTTGLEVGAPKIV
jgi:PLAC8 family